MNKSIKVTIIGDGNCLFRCFSYFLYNSQNFHNQVRLKIVNHVINNWSNYEEYILGNEYYNNISNYIDYKNYMSRNATFGNEFEISVFVDMFDVYVSVYSKNSNFTHIFGKKENPFKLELQLYNEHYDIIDYCNNNIQSKIKAYKNNFYKRKIHSIDSIIPNKKLKLESDDKNLKNKQKKIKKLEHYSHYGDMNYECEYCSAVYWKNEKKKSSCCHKGKIRLSPLSKYCLELKNLILTDKNFRYLIRYYNNLYSFATFNANFANERGKAIYNLKIQGQVCHKAPNTLIPANNEKPYCGQLYIFDQNIAFEKRLEANKNLAKEHLEIISEVLENNPYTKQYKHLHQISNINNLPNYKMYFIRKNDKQKHRYNKPLTSECGAIIVSDTIIPYDYDLCVYPKDDSENKEKHIYLSKLSHHVDPMVFPLFFPAGDLGWSIGYTKRPNANENENLTILQYYSYRLLAYRPNAINFNPLLYGGKLTQQFFLHAQIMVENNRMNFFRNNQKQLRIECYQGLLDHVINSASNDSNNLKKKERLGNIFILPATYIGSPRYMQQHYQDAMAIVRSIGRPDLFITMTCNPKWKELKEVLKKFPEGTTPNDIPNIVDRLFHLKFHDLLNDVIKNNIFGRAIAYVYTIEFQKRGLPHAHILVTLHPNDKLMTPERIDKFISAEIPNDDEKDLQKLVIKHMLHGPHNEKSPCLDKNKNICKKKFPKSFNDYTFFQKNGYPEYKRRNNKLKNYHYKNKNINKEIPVDNSMVVSYNKFLLQKYKCHINVEYCASIQSIKYIFDYIHKGGDKAFCKLKKINDNSENDEVYDEITNFIDGRYLSPMEAAWRLLEFALCGRSHTVVRLAVHTENQQKIIFQENCESDALNNWRTTLTAWFELNQKDEYARNISYVNIPNYYVYNVKTKSWVKRTRIRKNYAIGRLNIVSPKDTERFHLKLILNRVKGAKSFEELRTYENVTYNTYKEAAIAMGLVESDQQIFDIFDEACNIMLPFQLRKYFGWLLLTENILGNKIWEKYKKYFIEDFKENQENNALIDINNILMTEGMSCKNYGLPEPNLVFENENYQVNEKFISVSKNEFNEMYNKMNNAQLNIFNEIIKDENKIYFIDGPGGSGKTFLYKTLIHYFCSLRKKILSMAWTGIASILLPMGMTSHRTFRLPLDLSNIESAFLKLDTDKKKLRESDVIIWDEASMIPKKALEIVNNTLQDVCGNQMPFGGKLIILGGDFRQILPVIKNGFRKIIVEETIKYSYLWPLFKVLKLEKNIRCRNENFASFLLQIGEGKIDEFIIPNEWKTDDICKSVYKNINSEICINNVILAAHNDDVNNLNNKILNLLDSEIKVYFSIDYATHKGVDQSDKNIYLKYPIETLNNIREGLPPHKLELKINAIVMLIRNLSISDGLCNGTRLKIINLYKFNIEAEIITGEKVGNKVFIPRITLNTGESSALPFILYRKQFPIVLAFAMTINKSQGQSFDVVGLFIRKPLFSHGQLYVALSRSRNSEKIYIENKSDNLLHICNIVWKEIFN